MKKLTLTLTIVAFAMMAFAQTDYKMWETMYVKPKSGHYEDLEKAMAAHIQKFHPVGPYGVHLWEVFTGPHEGEWLWAMGPCTFTDIDSRPSSAEHDDDWNTNVEPLIEKAYDSKYWRLNEKLSHSPENAPSGKVLWSSYDLKDSEKYRWNDMMKKVKEVYQQKNYPYIFEVYENQFASEDGWDVVIEWGFDKWAFFDEENKFVKDYEEIHGEGTWKNFMKEYDAVVLKTMDELAEYMKEASSK